MFKRMCAALGLFVLVFPLFLGAQETTGALRGFVTDDKGERLPGVSIEIQSEALMMPRSTIADANGLYRFLYLPPGLYTVCAKLQGFDTCWLKGVRIQVGNTSTADVQLKMGGLETTIEVKATAPLIDTERSSKSISVNSMMLATLPIAPR
jgi:hypothetical protein